MNRFLFATICSVPLVLVSAGMARSQTTSSAEQSGGSSNSHSQDDHQRSQDQNGGTGPARSSKSSSDTADATSGSEADRLGRDEQVEGASSGTTAPTDGTAALDANRSQNGARPRGEQQVVEPKEP